MKYSKVVMFSIVSLTLLSFCKKDFENARVVTKDKIADTLTIKEMVAESNLVFDYLPATTSNEIVRHKY
ncbi:hypothetical protein [Flavobacterium sp. Arc2]|uniref:hypothetical protein n=1 Tax=Flavobacterium sp. Arc2 TaxID=3046685 RepID=UPI00352C2FF8